MVVETNLIEESTHDSRALSVEQVTLPLQKVLRSSLGSDGILSDLVECSELDLESPVAIAPWKEFDSKRLYRSSAATTALRALLCCNAPGTSSSFEDILSAVASGGTCAAERTHCYLLGGQVRDVLRGRLSADIDFNYSCAARDVAAVAVANEWPTKYKCVGDGVTVPNCERNSCASCMRPTRTTFTHAHHRIGTLACVLTCVSACARAHRCADRR